MLPLPNLDNKTYQQLFDESVKLIHKYHPQWTDENHHDPGITMIEMLAWLVEMQQYYLNQITDKSYHKFLKLLGVTPCGFVPASTNICFSDVEVSTKVLKNMPLFAGDIPFELCEEIELLPVEISKVLVKTFTRTDEHTLSIKDSHISFYAFGPSSQTGNTLYIGFDRPLPLNKRIKLYVDIYDNYPVKMAPLEAGTELIPSEPLIRFKYYCDGGWKDFSHICDKTSNLSESGEIIFEMTNEMSGIRIFPANDKERCWICLNVIKDGFLVSPRIKSLTVNSASAVQKETICSLDNLSKNGNVLVLDNYLPFAGESIVQIKKDDNEWVDLESSCKVIKNDSEMTTNIILENEDLPDGKNNVRVISFLPSLKSDLALGVSSGQMSQVFKLKYFPVLKNMLKVQVVKEYDSTGNKVWEDWELIDSLESSGKKDKHYTLDEGTGEVVFGDGIKGMIPQKGSEIRAVSYGITYGEKGNLGRNIDMEIPGITDDYSGIIAFNINPATRGKDAESLEEMLLRYKKEQKNIHRAVTSKDYEDIVLRTPQLRIARAKAIPGFNPDTKDTKAASHFTVVVVPYGESRTPIPDEMILRAVKLYLDRHRQITTSIHVVGPQYVEVKVHASIVEIEGKKVNPEKIISELERFLTPLTGDDLKKGWPIGAPVYKSDIYGIIKGVEGVSYIKDMWIRVIGSGGYRNDAGDIIIPPTGLVYSGEHEIEIELR